ncbi:restriction endonuclease, SacI family [Leptospira licerasiae]|uniref:restriction endonuclease, SacI family n=1 Tax=Leptospira licerasiae TaxID=447106 RepID=UPI003016D789
MQIDFAKAEKILLHAHAGNGNEIKENDITKLISKVINGGHKTYKYILLTGLLAKCVNDRLNPIALQAGAPVDGAFDARSLCHRVVVPFERKFLHNALGGSNEPFLNKPARFTHLSKTNAVRDGNDRATLNYLIEIFNAINANSSKVLLYLQYALIEFGKRYENLEKLYHIESDYDPASAEIFSFINKFLQRSLEGEAAVLVVATLERLYWEQFDENVFVYPHKVNQSGASSRQIGDIDVYEDKSFLYAIEVKDKNFLSHDIEHAFDKIIKHKGSKGVFIFGPNATFDHKQIEITLYEYEKRNFYTLFLDIFIFARIMLFRIQPQGKKRFLETLFTILKEINCKNETRAWVKETLSKLGWRKGKSF